MLFMEKILSFDKQGRLYIPEELRKILQTKTLVVSSINDGICLKSIEDDPLEALSRLGKERLKGKSIDKLKKEARKEIEENAIKKLRR